MTLRVGIGAAPFRPESVEFVRQAERLGVDSVWCPEFWAGDAQTPRTPGDQLPLMTLRQGIIGTQAQLQWAEEVLPQLRERATSAARI